jgi:hypothetical protein
MSTKIEDFTKWMEEPDYRDDREYRERFDQAVKRVTEYVDNVGCTWVCVLRKKFPEWSDIMDDVIEASALKREAYKPAPQPITAHGFEFENEQERQQAYADLCDGKEPKIRSWSPDKVQRPRLATEVNELGFNNQNKAKNEEMFKGRKDKANKARRARMVERVLVG